MTLKDRTKSIVHRSRAVEKGMSLGFAMFKDGDDFSTFPGRGKCRNLKEELKCR